MSRLSNGMTFVLAATAVVAAVQLEVTSSVRATSLPMADIYGGEPLHDINRANKSARLAFERSDELDVTYVLYDGRTRDNATATRIRLETPAPVREAAARSELAWEQSAEFRDTCEPLVSPMIAEELRIAPRRCPT